MGKGVNISIPASEQAKFKRWTDSLSKKNRSDCQQLVANTARTISKRAKQFAPVDKSGLKNSIHPVLSSDRLSAEVVVNVEYGPYQEFGTGSFASSFVPTLEPEVQKEAARFKGHGIRKVNMRAQPYLFPAVRISMTEFRQNLRKLGFK